MNIDTFLYVPTSIVRILREFTFDLGFVQFTAFEFATFCMLISIILAFVRRLNND